MPDIRSSPALAAALDATADALAAARRVVVLTGAGASAESGIPTFRDALTGYWSRFDAEAMATEVGFRAQSSVVQAWYRARIGSAAQAEPNGGHRALADLAGLVPAFTLVTQNVDDLHERAGSADVLHLHGSLASARCVDCGAAGVLPPLAPGDEAAAALATPLACDACGGALRPGVVWFGEALPSDVFEAAVAATDRCDVFLSVGTSGQVEPAASLARMAAATGAFVAEVNPAPVLGRLADASLAGPGGEVLPRVVRRLRDRIAMRDDAAGPSGSSAAEESQ